MAEGAASAASNLQEERRRQDEAVRQSIMERLEETGEKERLKELLREKLAECGWRDELKEYCKEVIRSKGVEKITVDDLVTEITPRGRGTSPCQPCRHGPMGRRADGPTGRRANGPTGWADGLMGRRADELTAPAPAPPTLRADSDGARQHQGGAAAARPGFPADDVAPRGGLGPAPRPRGAATSRACEPATSRPRGRKAAPPSLAPNAARATRKANYYSQNAKVTTRRPPPPPAAQQRSGAASAPSVVSQSRRRPSSSAVAP